MDAVQSTSDATPKTPPVSADAVLATILATLEDKKAEDIVSIPLAGKSSMADHMIIASGRSGRQVATLADNVMRALRAMGAGRVRAEGMQQADWVLLDAGDVIVHVFRPEVRSFYNLEKMWGSEFAPDGATH